MLRIGVEKCGPQLEAWLWLSTYGVAPSEVERIGGSFGAVLGKLFPETAAGALTSS